MNKYETDLYQIIFFDRYGSKNGEMMFGTNAIQSDRIGRDVKREECDVNSYVVLRVIQNSLDRGMWDGK